MFPTAYDTHERFYNVSGEKTEIEYRLATDENGSACLVESGIRPIYEAIQASARGVALSSILPEILSGRRPLSDFIPDESQYMDLTAVPENIIDAENVLVRASNAFESLPVEIRADYHNQFRFWLKAVSTGEFSRRYGKKESEKIPDKVKKESEKKPDKAEKSEVAV